MEKRVPFRIFRAQWVNERPCAEENFASDVSGDFGVPVARARGRDFFLDITFY